MKKQNSPNTPHPKNVLTAAVAGAMHGAQDFAGFDDWFEVFRAGKQTDSQGNSNTFTEADLDSIVANHNADDPAPLVVGHPKTNAPAYGWTGDLKRDGDTLFAKATDVAPEFADAVEAKHYRKRSISIAADDNGGFKLRHIGFLGGVAPAVSGLKDLAFSDGDNTTTFEFSLGDAVRETGWALGGVGSVLRNVRDFFIDQFGLEKANEVIPSYQIDSLENTVASIQNTDTDEPVHGFSLDPDSLDPDTLNRSSQESDMNNKAKTFSQADIDAAVATATQPLTDRANTAEQQLAAQQFSAKLTGANATITQLVADGKVLPAQTPGMAEFIANLDNADDSQFEFSAADGEQPKKQSPQAWFADFMANQGKQIALGEHASEDPGTSSHNYSAPVGTTVDPDRAALHSKALNYQTEHKCTYVQAVTAVEQEIS